MVLSQMDYYTLRSADSVLQVRFLDNHGSIGLNDRSQIKLACPKKNRRLGPAAAGSAMPGLVTSVVATQSAVEALKLLLQKQQTVFQDLLAGKPRANPKEGDLRKHETSIV